MNIERLARAYARVRSAHNGDDSHPSLSPCEWCRWAAKQHVEAMTFYDDAEWADDYPAADWAASDLGVSGVRNE